MAHRIKDLRKQAGLTQEELARRCKVTRSAVALWETESTKTLKPAHLFAAASALGVDAEYLATGRKNVASSLTEVPIRARAMLESFMELPEHLQVQIGALVHSMATRKARDDDEREVRPVRPKRPQ